MIPYRTSMPAPAPEIGPAPRKPPTRIQMIVFWSALLSIIAAIIIDMADTEGELTPLLHAFGLLLGFVQAFVIIIGAIVLWRGFAALRRWINRP